MSTTTVGSQHVIPLEFGRRYLMAERAQGVYLWDEAGKRYIDGSAGSSAVVSIGHGVQEIVDAMAEQAGKLARGTAASGKPVRGAAASPAQRVTESTDAAVTPPRRPSTRMPRAPSKRWYFQVPGAGRNRQRMPVSLAWAGTAAIIGKDGPAARERARRARFGTGAVLSLAGLPVRALHNLGAEPAELVTVRRRRSARVGRAGR